MADVRVTRELKCVRTVLLDDGRVVDVIVPIFYLPDDQEFVRLPVPAGSE